MMGDIFVTAMKLELQQNHGKMFEDICNYLIDFPDHLTFFENSSIYERINFIDWWEIGSVRYDAERDCLILRHRDYE